MGEFDLIAQYFSRPPKRALLGVGDDCALLQPSAGMHQCVTTDMLVEGRHFLSTVDPYRLAQKALVVNLSDLSACGAKPYAFTLALSLPQVDPAWLQRFSSGLWDTALEYDVDLVGGDTTKGPLSICITAFGEVPPGDALLRSAAMHGDDIYVSGCVGDARLALEVFRGHISLGADAFDRVRKRMECPNARVNLGVALRGVANACIDISDGLVGDLGHILSRSGVGAHLQTNWVEASDAVSQDLLLQPLPKRMDFALSGGDDYELIFTAPEEAREQVQEAGEFSNTVVTRIGTITQERGLKIFDPRGELMQKRFASFDHFVAN
jgi:thiamine-monophosphate kinase